MFCFKRFARLRVGGVRKHPSVFVEQLEHRAYLSGIAVPVPAAQALGTMTAISAGADVSSVAPIATIVASHFPPILRQGARSTVTVSVDNTGGPAFKLQTLIVAASVDNRFTGDSTNSDDRYLQLRYAKVPVPGHRKKLITFSFGGVGVTLQGKYFVVAALVDDQERTLTAASSYQVTLNTPIANLTAALVAPKPPMLTRGKVAVLNLLIGDAGGNAPVSGTITVTLLQSVGTTSLISDQQVGAPQVHLKIRPGITRRIKARFTVNASASPGSYYLSGYLFFPGSITLSYVPVDLFTTDAPVMIQ